MRHRTGYGYKPAQPSFTDGNGRNSINDFPIVPETSTDLRIHALASNHTQPQSAAENPAIQSGSPSRANEVSRGAEQERPPVPPAPLTCIPIYAAEPTDADTSLADAEAEAASLLARLRATGELAVPARPARPRPSAKKRRKKTRARKSKSLAPQPANLSPRDHHERHCSICNHPERDAIDEEFIHWHNVYDIAADYEVEARSIYRHAHAVGLFDRRDRTVRFALGLIIQQANRVEATADSVIRAVHAFTRVNRDGLWIDPPAHVVVSSGGRLAAPAAIAAAAATLELPASSASHPKLPVTGAE